MRRLLQAQSVHDIDGTGQAGSAQVQTGGNEEVDGGIYAASQGGDGGGFFLAI